MRIDGYIGYHSRASERVCGSLGSFLVDDLEKRYPTLTDAQSDKHQNQVAISGPCIDNGGTKFSIYVVRILGRSHVCTAYFVQRKRRTEYEDRDVDRLPTLLSHLVDHLDGTTESLLEASSPALRV
jgi:hypothetical protein